MLILTKMSVSGGGLVLFQMVCFMVCFFIFFTRVDFDKKDVESIGILLCFESGNTYNDDSLTTLFKIEPFNFKKSCFC